MFVRSTISPQRTKTFLLGEHWTFLFFHNGQNSSAVLDKGESLQHRNEMLSFDLYKSEKNERSSFHQENQAKLLRRNTKKANLCDIQTPMGVADVKGPCFVFPEVL